MRCLLIVICTVITASAGLPEGLPGVEVSTLPGNTSAPPQPTPPDSLRGKNWIAPSVEDQLARDPTLISLGKGAVFVPCYSEPQREPEVVVFHHGHQVAAGLTGTRILLDSGTYELRFGSGTVGQRLSAEAHVEEGHTTVIPPTWGGLLVETLTELGEYFEGQYDLVRMDHWVSYGRGSGYNEERLQDIKVWILPPGLYRLSKTGESYNSLTDYITVQINPGELHSVELIFDKDVGGDLIAGGTKSLNPRLRVGRNWTYGLRVGGNAEFTRSVDNTNQEQQNLLFSTDLRTRAQFDNARYLGINEIFLQNSFLKTQGAPITASTDYLQMRSTWVRRLNTWIGPYVRGQATTHLFPTHSTLDSIYILRSSVDSAGATHTDTTLDTSKSFQVAPSFFPLQLAEGAGVNVQWVSRYEIELSTELGLGAQQQISHGDYLAPTTNTFEISHSLNQVGIEGILDGKFRLSTQFTLDLRAEIFAENAQFRNTQLQDLEADFRLFLTRNLEIGYVFLLSESQYQVANRFPYSHDLSVRLNFNY